MAKLTIRMRDDLKQKAQQETLAFFSDRLRDVDQEALHKRVLKFMRKTRPGEEPSVKAIQRAVRG